MGGLEDVDRGCAVCRCVSEVDADRDGRRCRAWTLDRGPWTVAWDLLSVRY